jgi:hypothetical protein
VALDDISRLEHLLMLEQSKSRLHDDMAQQLVQRLGAHGLPTTMHQSQVCSAG